MNATPNTEYFVLHFLRDTVRTSSQPIVNKENTSEEVTNKTNNDTESCMDNLLTRPSSRANETKIVIQSPSCDGALEDGDYTHVTQEEKTYNPESIVPLKTCKFDVTLKLIILSVIYLHICFHSLCFVSFKAYLKITSIIIFSQYYYQLLMQCYMQLKRRIVSRLGNIFIIYNCYFIVTQLKLILLNRHLLLMVKLGG